jgi:hypothetical protein
MNCICSFFVSLYENSIVRWIFLTFCSWLASKLLDSLFLNKVWKSNRIPKWFNSVIKRILIILSLPFNLLWFGLSYPCELFFKYKCRIRIIHYWWSQTWTWTLCKENFEDLNDESKEYVSLTECKEAFKKWLWLRFISFPKKDWIYTYYRIYLKKSEYEWFIELKNSPKITTDNPFIHLAAKWILR